MAETLKEKTAKGLFWGGLSNVIQQLLSLVIGVFLARMLTQDDYGMVGMLAIFSAMAAALYEGGFISALCRKKEVTHEDYNAVFWVSVMVSLSLYIILFLCAPLIADFYGVPELTPLARFIFIGFFLSSLGVAPRAITFRKMMVRENTIVYITAQILSGIVGISMAANGFAYWGIATQTLVYVSVIAFLNFYFAKWHPTLSFNFAPIKELIGFSSKLVLTNIVNIVNNNLFAVVLGKLYTPHVVGNFTQANKWNTMGYSLGSNMIVGIAQPVFAKTNDDPARQNQIFRKVLRFTAFVSFPFMFGLSMVSEEFIVILLTEKWAESAKLLQILCIAGAFIPFSTLFSNLLISKGKSTTYLLCTFTLCVVQFVAAWLSSAYGIIFMVWVYAGITISWLAVWFLFAKKEIGLKAIHVIKDISPYLVLAGFIAVAVYEWLAVIPNIYLRFFLKLLVAGSTYCAALWLLKSTIFKESIAFIVKREL
jgi:O-antigen/teichoic acid export membrane protein